MRYTASITTLALLACGDKDTGAASEDTSSPAADTAPPPEDTGEAVVEDVDGDGFSTDEGDCDDADASIYPGAGEIADDGIDQDCDGADEISPPQLAGLSAGALIVTEIMKKPSGDGDAGEWLEIRNQTSEDVDLLGLVVYDLKADSFTVESSVVVAAGGYAILGISDDAAINGGVTVDYAYGYGADKEPVFKLGNSGDEVYLGYGETVFDSVIYDNDTFPDDTGASLSLDPGSLDAAANDDGSSWCDALSTFGDGDRGTPGADNDLCSLTDSDSDGYTVATDCDDDDASVHPDAEEIADDGIDQDCDGADLSSTALVLADLVEGDLFVSEIMKNPSAVDDDTGEWFEIRNASGAEVQLNGLVVSDDEGESFTVFGSVLATPAGHVVFAVSADTKSNGGVTVDYAYDKADMSLSNGDDQIILSYDGTVFDSVSYDDDTFPDTTGATLSLDPPSADADENDDGANWCAGQSAYGDGDLGTPGATNDACPVPLDDDGDGYTDDVDCDDTDASIYPGAEEIADDGIDQDCDGADEISPTAMADVGAGELIITEIMNDPDAVDDSVGQWLELYNSTDNTIDLDGLELGTADGTSVTVLGSVEVAALGYAVLGISDDTTINGGVTIPYAYGWSLPFDGTTDTLTLSYDGLTIDEVAYDGGADFPDPTGASLSLDGAILDSSDNDDGANWCAAKSTFGDGDLGTPGSANDSCSETITAAELAAGDLIITEIMQNPDAVDDSLGEWLEIYNSTDSTVDLSGIELSDDGSDSHTIADTVEVPAGGYAVLGRDDDSTANGGVTVSYAYGSDYTLANGDDEVILSYDGLIIDEVAYDGGTDFPDPTGASMSLDGAILDSSDNDDGTNWCAESTSALDGGDYGTPGSANNQCN